MVSKTTKNTTEPGLIIQIQLKNSNYKPEVRQLWRCQKMVNVYDVLNLVLILFFKEKRLTKVRNGKISKVFWDCF